MASFSASLIFFGTVSRMGKDTDLRGYMEVEPVNFKKGHFENAV